MWLLVLVPGCLEVPGSSVRVVEVLALGGSGGSGVICCAVVRCGSGDFGAGLELVLEVPEVSVQV